MTIHLTRDQGFSLTELIISISLLTIVLGAAYGGLNAIQASSAVSDRQSSFATEIGTPLLAIEEVLQQTLYVEAASAYSMTVTTDVDHDNRVERHVIEAGTDRTLTHRVYNTNSLMQNTGLRYLQAWSTRNSNRMDAVPLFYYYDKAGNPITDYARVIGNVKSMNVIVVVEREGRRFRSSRTVVLRNL